MIQVLDMDLVHHINLDSITGSNVSIYLCLWELPSAKSFRVTLYLKQVFSFNFIAFKTLMTSVLGKWRHTNTQNVIRAQQQLFQPSMVLDEGIVKPSPRTHHFPPPFPRLPHHHLALVFSFWLKATIILRLTHQHLNEFCSNLFTYKALLTKDTRHSRTSVIRKTVQRQGGLKISSTVLSCQVTS